ncbi:MAG: FHA domain-containing protein [Tetrasphaera sp.]
MTTETDLTLDFAGELFTIKPGETFTIGRDGDLAIDDNPYLHRVFVTIDFQDGLWWVANVGSRLATHLTDRSGLMRATLAPGARSPLVFPESLLTFTAGSTAYELILTTTAHDYDPQPHRLPAAGDTTIAPTAFTESQLLAVLALAEPLLRRVGTGAAEVPTAVAAARRLGWTQTRFNRKLDNVCDKLIQAGVTGLRGEVGASATNRRLSLVEYAVSTLLVTASDLTMLDREARSNAMRLRDESDEGPATGSRR